MGDRRFPTAHELFPFPAKGLQTTSAEFFVDRPDILTIVEDSLISLQNGHPHRIRFIGERGAGKTSILNFLAEVRCPALRILPVLINAVDVGVRKYSVIEQILASVKGIAITKYGRYKIRRIAWAVKEHLSGISTPVGGIDLHKPEDQRDLILKAGGDLERHLRQIQKSEDIKGVLVMIDDADEVQIEVLGRLGEMFNTSNKFSVYLAMGRDLAALQPEQGASDDAVPEVREVSAGVLAYWERVVVRNMDENEIRQMLALRLAKYPEFRIQIPDEDMFRIINLCGGNGRLAILLANKSVSFGREHRDNGTLLHITRQVLDGAKEASEGGLARKLAATEQILLGRDENAIKPRWW